MNHSAVIIKSNPNGLVLNLDAELPFDELCQAAAEKFRTSAAFFKHAKLAIAFRGRKLSLEEERILTETIVDASGIHVVCILDEDHENAEHFKNALEKSLKEQQKRDAGQFYRGTLHSGQTLESETSIVIIGDVKPGAQVISKGNVVILGCCMGSIYAGASGNPNCFIAALTLKPLQVKIADRAARSAIVKKTDTGEYPIDPQIVYIKEDHLQFRSMTQADMADFYS